MDAVENSASFISCDDVYLVYLTAMGAAILQDRSELVFAAGYSLVKTKNVTVTFSIIKIYTKHNKQI